MTTLRAPQVRPASQPDLEVIVEFNRRLASETENKTLDPIILSRGVAQALNHPDRLRYWVAQLDGRVVGQAAVTREWSDWRNGWIWWFQSVYVAAEYRGHGVFRALFQTIEAAGHEEGNVIGLRLYVEEQNLAAQRTYAAVGLAPGGYKVYEKFWIAL
jgi:GNAT superfamily N-acetyltransferase